MGTGIKENKSWGRIPELVMMGYSSHARPEGARGGSGYLTGA